AAVPRPRSSPPSSRLPAAGLQRSGLHNAKEVSYIRQMSRPTIRMVGTKEKLWNFRGGRTFGSVIKEFPHADCTLRFAYPRPLRQPQRRQDKISEGCVRFSAVLPHAGRPLV